VGGNEKKKEKRKQIFADSLSHDLLRRIPLGKFENSRRKSLSVSSKDKKS
jgi:hypothetical protein